MKLRLHPSAERDVAEAAAFYERESSARLAARFVTEIKRIGSLLLEHPKIGFPRSGERRSFGMQVFPYSVVYRVREEEIEVLVVKHDRRRPSFGTRRK